MRVRADPIVMRGDERGMVKPVRSVIEQVDAAVKGGMVGHLKGDIRVAVVDTSLTRGPGDDWEQHDLVAVDEPGLQQCGTGSDSRSCLEGGRGHRPPPRVPTLLV